MAQRSNFISIEKINSRILNTGFKDKTESEIWEYFRNGSRSALVYIYNTYKDELFEYGSQFSKDNEQVKDNIQELFVYLYRNSSMLGATSSIKFYLFRSLRRLIAKESKIKLNTFYKVGHQSKNEYFKAVASQETLIVQKENKDSELLRLRDAINNLPSKQREVIYYFFYKGFTYQEIQTIMDYKDVQTVRNLIHRAIKSLKEKLTVKSASTLRHSLFLIFF